MHSRQSSAGSAFAEASAFTREAFTTGSHKASRAANTLGQFEGQLAIVRADALRVPRALISTIGVNAAAAGTSLTNEAKSSALFFHLRDFIFVPGDYVARISAPHIVVGTVESVLVNYMGVLSYHLTNSMNVLASELVRRI